MFGTDTNSRVSENSFEILLKFKFMNILIDYFDIWGNLLIYNYTTVLLWGGGGLFSFVIINISEMKYNKKGTLL